MEHARAMDGHFRAKLEALKARHADRVGDVRGIGMFWGVDLVWEKENLKIMHLKRNKNMKKS